MSVETFIGWRYLKAKRKQAYISFITFISIGGIALSVTTLMVVMAVMSGTESEMKDKILGVNAHIMVLQYGGTMEDYKSLIPKVQDVAGVVSVSPFIYSQVMMGSAGGVAGVVLRGIDPEAEAKYGHLKKSLRSGQVSVLSQPSDETEQLPAVILGSVLAEQLKVKNGDTVRLFAPMGEVNQYGGRSPKVGFFRVGGVFFSGMYDYDSAMAYISLSEAQKLLGFESTVTGLEVRVRNVFQADVIREKIIAKLGDSYWARDWKRMNYNLFTALMIQKVVLGIILSLTTMVAAFNIVSTLIMVVMEKKRDIGVLKSIGATAWNVLKIFVFQGMVIGMTGTFLGFVGGVTLCTILDHYRFIDLPPDVYFITTLPAKMEPLEVGLILLTALLISFTATIYPAWQASRLRPADALRYE